MSIDLEKLEQLAKAATQGPWFDDSEWSPDDVSIWSGERGDSAVFLGNIGWARFVEVGVACDVNTRNGQYIAAANPSVILELIGRLRAAEFELQLATQRESELQSIIDKAQGQEPVVAVSMYNLGGHVHAHLLIPPAEAEHLIGAKLYAYPIPAKEIECAATGESHSFGSHGPSGAIQCEYCGQPKLECNMSDVFDKQLILDVLRAYLPALSAESMTSLREKVNQQILLLSSSPEEHHE